MPKPTEKSLPPREARKKLNRLAELCQVSDCPRRGVGEVLQEGVPKSNLAQRPILAKFTSQSLDAKHGPCPQLRVKRRLSSYPFGQRAPRESIGQVRRFGEFEESLPNP
jgi:hypothetical protein